MSITTQCSENQGSENGDHIKAEIASTTNHTAENAVPNQDNLQNTADQEKQNLNGGKLDKNIALL